MGNVEKVKGQVLLGVSVPSEAHAHADHRFKSELGSLSFQKEHDFALSSSVQPDISVPLNYFSLIILTDGV